MAFFSKKVNNVPSMVARVNGIPFSNSNLPTTISGYKSRNTDLLCSLRQERDVYRAIELITEQHPDASQAIQSYVRLSNNGFQMEIFTPDGKQNVAAEEQWREFCQRAGDTNTKGFDGLIDQMHDSQIRFGGMGIECSVSRKAKDIDGIHPILPQWITWEVDKQGKWHAFQQQGTKRIDLSDGNFFWVAMDNDVGKPTGKLLLESALMAIDRHLEFVEDSGAALRQAGYPRNDLALDRQAIIDEMPASVKNDRRKVLEYLDNVYNDIIAKLRSLNPRDALVHWNSMVWNKSQGQNSRTVDLRSFTEVYDPQVLNGLKIPGIMLNRTSGITETWGTVQFKIMVLTINSAQRGSKRLSEQLCQFWLRVNGIQGTCKFTHNPVDWETELTKLEVALKKQLLHHNAEDYEWQDKATAAKDAMNITKLPKPKPKKDSGNTEDSEDNDEQDE